MRKFQFITIIAIISFLSSCGGGSNQIDLFPVKVGDNYEFIDNEGKIVINPQFSEATIFRDNLALVKSSGDDSKWGFIDKKGKYVVNANYKSATVFSEGLAWVVEKNSAPYAIDGEGKTIINLSDAQNVKIFKNGLAAFSILIKDNKHKKINNDKNSEEKTYKELLEEINNLSKEISKEFNIDNSVWGFIDQKGKVVINPQFFKIGTFNEKKCAVMNNKGKWGYIDEAGKLLINYQFEKAGKFKNGYAIVEFDDKFGVIDKEGKYIINPQFGSMFIDGDEFLIRQNDKYGWCDKEGQIIINPQFEDAKLFKENNLAAVKINDSWGYIDSDGKIVINPQFDNAYNFNNGLAFVVSGDKVGIIGEDGKFIVNPQFDDMAMDLIKFLSNETSEYELVKTDFFDINSIISSIDYDFPEGLDFKTSGTGYEMDFNTTYDEITKKFGYTKTDFKKYKKYKKIFVNKKIKNNTATLDFIIFGNPWMREVKDYANDIYGSLQYVPKKAKPIKFEYHINLSGKALEKKEIILDALKKKIKLPKQNKNFFSYSYPLYSGDIGYYTEPEGEAKYIQFRVRTNKIIITVGILPGLYD